LNTVEKKGGFLSNMNLVMGLVYLGASVLIVVVGLRGLGNTVGKLGFIPSLFVDENGFISANLVIFAILLEFCMLLLLSFATMLHKDEPNVQQVNVQQKSSGLDVQAIRLELEKMKDLAREEKVLISGYLDEFEQISDKINRIQEKNVKALRSIKEEVSR